MRNYLTYFTIAILFLSSCNNQDDEIILKKNESFNPLSRVEVVSLSGSSTRAKNEEEKTLRFEDVEHLNKVVEILENRNDRENEDFFRKINFRGIFLRNIEANKAIDDIFDIEDYDTFLNEVKKYKEQYGDLLKGNVSEYDLTPNLQFDDEVIRLLGNKNGEILVGEKVYAPKASFSSFRGLLSGPYAPTFREFPGNPVNIMLREGKYQGSVTLGACRENGDFMVECASQKKKKFWKRRNETDYSGDVYINGAHFFFNVLRKKRQAVFLSPFVNVGQYAGKKITVSISNFKVGCCPSLVGNQTFELDLRNR